MTKRKVQKDKQRSTKHTHKTKDQVTRTHLKLVVNLGRVSSSCFAEGTRRVDLMYTSLSCYKEINHINAF
jgi:ribosomal protein L44E